MSPAVGFALYYDRALAGIAGIVGILLVAAMLMVTADVCGRYFFNSPIGWTLEYTEHILVHTPFLGMAWLVRRKQTHVRIDFIVSTFSQRSQKLIDAGVSFVSSAVCAFTGYYAIETTVEHLARGAMTSGVYPIPKSYLLGVIALGLVLTAIEFARRGRERVRNWRD